MRRKKAATPAAAVTANRGKVDELGRQIHPRHKSVFNPTHCTGPLPPAKLRQLAERVHALGPWRLFNLLRELQAGADLHDTIERYAARTAPIAAQLDTLWNDWLTARKRAMQSHNICDGLDAGRRWSKFLAAFVAPDLIKEDRPQ
jgi:hypothetical protein